MYIVKVGISILLRRKYASRNLTDRLAGLSFSSSYYKAKKLKLSAGAHSQLTYKPDAFKQFVSDNVAECLYHIWAEYFPYYWWNQMYLSSEHVEKDSEIPRLNRIPTSAETRKLGSIPPETYAAVKGDPQNATVAPIYTHSAPHTIL